MKLFTVAAAALIAATSTVQASDIEVCYDVESIAESVMVVRQQTTMSAGQYRRAYIEQTKGKGLEDSLPIIMAIVDHTWSQPKMHTSEMQQMMVDENRRFWFDLCLRGMGN